MISATHMMENFDPQEMLHEAIMPVLAHYCDNRQNQPEAIWAETTKLLTGRLPCTEKSADQRFLILITLMFRLSQPVSGLTAREAYKWMMQTGREVMDHRWRKEFMRRLKRISSGEPANAYELPDRVMEDCMVSESMPMESRQAAVRQALIDMVEESKEIADMNTLTCIKEFFYNYGISHEHITDDAIKIINKQMHDYYASRTIFIDQFNGQLNGNVQQIMLTEEERKRIPMLHLTRRMPAETADGEKTRQENMGRKRTHLFSDRKGMKDEKLTDRMSKLFKKKLYEHVPMENVMMETHLNNIPSALFIEFYLKWADEGLVEKYVNGRACYRFLTEDCDLPCGSTEKHFSDWVKKIIIQKI